MWEAQGNVFVAAVTVFGTLIGVALGAYLNKKAAVSAAREGRVWEWRRLGYSVLLEKLGEVSKYADRLDSGYNGPHADPDGFHTSERCRENEKDLWNTWAECEAEFRNNRLVFSETSVSAFRELDDDLRGIGLTEEFPPDRAAATAKSFRNTYSTVMRQAEKELGLNR